jgi:hypothetical protein
MSDFFISREDVDEWKHVVKRKVPIRNGRKRKQAHEHDEANEDEDADEEIDVGLELGEEEVMDEDGSMTIIKNIQGDPTDASDTTGMVRYIIGETVGKSKGKS